jgi:hypothetical protein
MFDAILGVEVNPQLAFGEVPPEILGAGIVTGDENKTAIGFSSQDLFHLLKLHSWLKLARDSMGFGQ